MNRLLIPSETRPRPPTGNDARIGHFVSPAAIESIPAGCRFALVGFPCDEGVRTNGGRPGAAAGPDAVRERLFRLTPDARLAAHAEAFRQAVDLGNVVCDGELAASQSRLGEVVAAVLGAGMVPIVIGGGHETAFGHFLGYAAAARPVSLVNIDAHADVRPLVGGQGHSGSPFRQALEHPSGACRRYAVCGLAPHAVAADHVQFVLDRGGSVTWSDETTEQAVAEVLAAAGGDVLVSMDLDAVDRSHAPGVSAPNPHGLSAATWLAIADQAGRWPHVRSLDIVELNPRYDIDHATARLAALTIWRFVRGRAEAGV